MTLLERFNSKYEPEPNSGCWLWTGAARGPIGNEYGHMRIGKEFTAAHRVSVMLHTGHKPSVDHDVMHKCDNRFCVNPDHLSVGTKKDNMVDCARKDRRQVPNLADEVIADIRKREHPANYYVKLHGLSSHWVVYDLWRSRTYQWKEAA